MIYINVEGSEIPKKDILEILNWFSYNLFFLFHYKIRLMYLVLMMIKFLLIITVLYKDFTQYLKNNLFNEYDL